MCFCRTFKKNPCKNITALTTRYTVTCWESTNPVHTMANVKVECYLKIKTLCKFTLNSGGWETVDKNRKTESTQCSTSIEINWLCSDLSTSLLQLQFYIKKQKPDASNLSKIFSGAFLKNFNLKTADDRCADKKWGGGGVWGGGLMVVPYLVSKLSQPVRLQQQRDEGGGGK